MQTHERLREAVSLVGKKRLAKDLPRAFHLVIWELMKTQTKLKELEEKLKKHMKRG